jgi:hypothetical protein
MIQPDEEILKAIISLEGNSHWETLRKKWFRPSLSELWGPGEAVFAHGMFSQLIQLMDMIDEARDRLKLLELRKPKRS